MVSLRANGVSLSLRVLFQGLRTCLEGSGNLDQFWLSLSRSGGLSHGFPQSCALTSGFDKSHDVVSYGHVHMFKFVKGDEHSSSQYPLFRFVAPATND